MSNLYDAKQTRYNALGYGMSWVRVSLLPTLPLN